MTTASRRGMTPADLFRISFLGDAQISPDGSRVAFVRTRLDEEKDEYLSTIWVVPASGGEPRQFTFGPKRDTTPRWSPDGTQLAFLSERDGKKRQLYVMAVDGGEARRLTDLKQSVEDLVWSPDGSRVAITSRLAPDEPDEKDKEKSKPARVITSLRYKSNDGGFVYDKRRHIFVVSLGGTGGAAPAVAGWGRDNAPNSEQIGEPVQITDGDWDDSAPSWSPDGAFLAFASARHDERDYDQVTDIWVVAAEGGEPRQVTPGRGPSANPSWSPDGATIAYVGNEYALDMGRNNDVFVIPAAGGEPRNLTKDLDRTCAPFAGNIGPLWSPDSRWIYFGVEDQGDVPIYRVPATGGVAERVLGGERWLMSLSISADGARIAVSSADPVHPAEVSVANADGTDERRLTGINDAIADEVAFQRPERYRFERDGFTIDGWVIKPANYEPGKRYPALLNVHGGPATQYGHTFFDEFQVYAGAGYAVIFTNPRGSQGYGESFTRAVRADWGGGDYEDVMMGVDEALKRFDFIDPERLGVMGGSYGGFMTSWVVGHTDRFKAACSERAVNNTYTLFGTSDIGSFFSETHAGALPWEDMQWYIDRSPLTYARNITTPLLIMHAENDLRCPMEQAEQLFTVLMKLRREVLFIRFPDETHEMSRAGRPHHRRDRFKFILEWFEKYLEPSRVAEREAAPA
ncbi:MAG: prolyl oligopeptidase family serine peptidase [Dehalococcoidia bacterium]